MHKIKQLIRALKWQRQIRAVISTQLSLLEGDGLFALGGLTEEEEDGVRLLARMAQRGGGPIIEFGTLFGLTTLVLAQEKPVGVKVITVDNFSWNPFGLPPSLHHAFTSKILRPMISSGAVELVDSDSQAFRAQYCDPVPCMVFLDADHSYQAVQDEIVWAKKMGVPIISGHDYGNLRFGVTRAVDECFPDGVEVRGMVWWHSPRPSAADPRL